MNMFKCFSMLALFLTVPLWCSDQMARVCNAIRMDLEAILGLHIQLDMYGDIANTLAMNPLKDHKVSECTKRHICTEMKFLYAQAYEILKMRMVQAFPEGDVFKHAQATVNNIRGKWEEVYGWPSEQCPHQCVEDVLSCWEVRRNSTTRVYELAYLKKSEAVYSVNRYAREIMARVLNQRARFFDHRLLAKILQQIPYNPPSSAAAAAQEAGQSAACPLQIADR